MNTEHNDTIRTSRSGKVNPITREMVVFSGTDIVSISRIAELLDEFGTSFADRVFTGDEQRYCNARTYPAQHYAARWAAKESFLKILGQSSPSIPTVEIAIVPTASEPRLSLGPRAEAALSSRLEAVGATNDETGRSVSLSHDRDSGYATAYVVVGTSVTDWTVADAESNATTKRGGGR